MTKTKGKAEWCIRIPLIIWELSIHNKEQWDLTYANDKPMRPIVCVHFSRKNEYCKRLFLIH